MIHGPAQERAELQISEVAAAIRELVTKAQNT